MRGREIIRSLDKRSVAVLPRLILAINRTAGHERSAFDSTTYARERRNRFEDRTRRVRSAFAESDDLAVLPGDLHR